MQRTSPSSPTPGSSKDKGQGRGERNRNTIPTLPPPPPGQNLTDSDSDPGDNLFDNKYAKMTLEDIKIAWNGASRAYSEAKNIFFRFDPLLFRSDQHGNSN